MTEPGFVEKLARDMARSGAEEKEAFLVNYLKGHPEYLRRIEDLVIEEAPIKTDTVFNDDFDSNEYKFVITYNWRIREITDEERVLRYVRREYEKLSAQWRSDPTPEIKETHRVNLTNLAWRFIQQGVKL